MASNSEKEKNKAKQPHAWKGTWDRPVKIDEACYDPLTVARMTDHNVRGGDEDETETEADLKEDKDQINQKAATKHRSIGK